MSNHRCIGLAVQFKKQKVETAREWEQGERFYLEKAKRLPDRTAYKSLGCAVCRREKARSHFRSDYSPLDRTDAF